MLFVQEQLKGDRMGRVIRDKSKFLNVSKKLIEKEFVSMTSMNTWVYEDDIGKICSFLISNDAPRISGTSNCRRWQYFENALTTKL